MLTDFEKRLRGASLLTAEILYYRPDYRSVLQSFSWQTQDTAPSYPGLSKFLDHWRRNVQATIHSIRIAHADWSGPREILSVDEVFSLH